MAEGDDPKAASKHDRILPAALDVFAAHGTSAATMQMVAEAAGVSVGLVQHHFGSKDGLIAAVDEHALAAIATVMAAPLPESATGAVVEVGRRVRALLAEHLTAMDYLAQIILAGTASGSGFFDTMVATGIRQWQHAADSDAAEPDLDATWAALNPLILTLGATILRRHLDRHLPEPFATPTQLQRWEQAVNALISRGQLGG